MVPCIENRRQFKLPEYVWVLKYYEYAVKY